MRWYWHYGGIGNSVNSEPVYLTRKRAWEELLLELDRQKIPFEIVEGRYLVKPSILPQYWMGYAIEAYTQRERELEVARLSIEGLTERLPEAIEYLAPVRELLAQARQAAHEADTRPYIE